MTLEFPKTKLQKGDASKRIIELLTEGYDVKAVILPDSFIIMKKKTKEKIGKLISYEIAENETIYVN